MRIFILPLLFVLCSIPPSAVAQLSVLEQNTNSKQNQHSIEQGALNTKGPDPILELGSDISICETNAPITIDAGAGFTNYVWNTSETTQSISVSSSGTYSVTTTAASGNTYTDAITVNIDSYPDPTISYIEAQCRTDAAFELTAATPGGTWDGAGIIGGNNFNPTSAGEGIHAITYAVSNGLCTAHDTILITVVNDVNATIFPITDFCETDPPMDLVSFWHTGIWTGTGITDAIDGTFDPSIAGPGDHIIQFNIGTGGTCSDESTITIHVDSVYEPTILSAGPFCSSGEVVTLTADISGGTWSGTGITDQTAGTFDPSIVGSESTQVMYTMSSGACNNSDIITITIHPSPSVNLGGDQIHFDYDVPVTIDAGAGFSYLWNTSETSQTIDITTTGNYSVIVTDANGCTATDEMNLTVNTTNSVNLGADQTLCDYDIPITIDAGAGFSYLWNTSETSQTIDVTTTGNYSVTITDINGITATDEINITVNPSPTIDLGGDQTLCDYDVPISIDAGAGFSYLWNTSETSQNIDIASTGNYSVIITDANGCTATNEIDITVNPSPTVDLGGDQTLCDYDVPISIDAGAGFSYLWNTSETSQTIDIALTGNYSVIITDANGCTATNEIDITVNPSPTVDLGGDQTLCDYDVPISIDAGAGFSYLWNTSETSQTIDIASTGNYSVIITDANGCTATDEIDITVNPSPTVDLGGDQTLCDYDVPVTIDAGAGFSYLWNTSETSQTIDIASTGNYSVIITDANGCTATDEIDITVNPSPTVDLGGDQTLCDYDVPISIDAGAGFSYLWNTSETSQTIDIASTGNYSVIITDANGCTATDEMNLTVNPNISVNLGADQTLCDYDIPITIDAGSGFSYLWNTSETSQTIDVTTTGNYSVTITDINGITATDEINITVNSSPTIDLGTDQTYCESEAPISINPGLFNEYLWNTTETHQIINVTSTGEYSVTITDNNGCSNSDQISITIDPMPDITINPIFPLCIYDDALVLTSVNYGGSWSGNGIIDSNTGTFDPEIAGIGTSTVFYQKTEGTCTAISSINIDVHDIPSINILHANNPICFGSSTGEIQVNSIGTNNPTFSWAGYGEGTTLSNIPAGEYSVIVEDEYGCSNSTNVSLIDPPSMIVTIITEDVTCFGLSDGMAIANTSGGNPPYKYQWNNGSTSSTIYNLHAGNYTVTVEDINQCSVIKTIEITEPDLLEISTSIREVECGIQLGSCNIIATGGNQGYTYSWENPDWTGPYQSNLLSGYYSITVTDSEGCNSNTTITIPTSGNINVSISIESEIICPGENSGELTAHCITPENINYMWNIGNITPNISNLLPGTYRVSVTDEWGCSGSAIKTLVNPDPISIDITTNDVKCFGESNGSAFASITGGTAPFSYNWDNISFTDSLNNVSEGSYNVTITDINNCIATKPLQISQPSAPVSTQILSTNITCFGYSDGKAIAQVAGGTVPYSYLWEVDGVTSNSQSITNLEENVYTLHIEDKNGCNTDTSIIITQPSPLLVNFTHENPSCIGNDNGYIEFEAIGGTEPYSYNSDIATQNLPHFHGLYEGNYNFTITDANGCNNKLNTIVLVDNPEECIRIPDAFTPNGDNTNDTWIIENIEMFPNSIVQIFNRWGQEVYFAKHGEDPWDGRFNGNLLPTATYLYVVNLNNASKPLCGTVTIIK